jgi:hypothetical protein
MEGLKNTTAILHGQSGSYTDIADFSYQNTINSGVTWSVDLNYHIDLDFSEDTIFSLTLISTDFGIWTSPPLVATIRSKEEGIKIGKKTSINGIDWYTYKLSKDGIDHPAFVKTTANVVINTLSQSVGANIGGALPTYAINDFDAHTGKLIDHIVRVLKQGGYGYKITPSGIYAIGLKECTNVGYGTQFCKSTKESYDATALYNYAKFTKSAMIQTHYEFVWTEEGFKTASFSAPMQSLYLRDKSIIGYLDEIAYFDKTDTQTAGQVGPIVLTHSHDGIVYPPGTSSGPIRSFSLTVHPPGEMFTLIPGQNPTTYEIYAVAVFDGVPWQDPNRWTGIEDTFTYVYNPLSFELPPADRTPPVIWPPPPAVQWVPNPLMRPLPDRIECDLMPTLAHATAVAPFIFWDMTKKFHTVDYDCDDIIPVFEPGQSLGGNRIESISLSKSGTKISTCVL